ncbi:hypothetical protein [Actinacidiphila alni]|nr:hypothetical protein [Actinacidiphila alni]
MDSQREQPDPAPAPGRLGDQPRLLPGSRVSEVPPTEVTYCEAAG